MMFDVSDNGRVILEKLEAAWALVSQANSLANLGDIFTSGDPDSESYAAEMINNANTAVGEAVEIIRGWA